MFEQLLSSGMFKKGTYFPNSGPGTKYLMIGDENLGYFGEVEVPEMPSQMRVQGDLPLPVGAGLASVYNPRFYWWKFFYKGQVLYYPSDSIFNGTTWDTTYNAGLIYGVDGVGKYPTSTPTNQMTKMRWQEKNGEVIEFIVRAIQGAPTDPASSDITNNEFTDLLTMVPGLNNSSTTLQPTGLFNNQMTYNSAAITSRYIGRKLNGDTTTSMVEYAKGIILAYRPILVLQKDVLYSPENVYTQFVGNVGPLSVVGAFTDAVKTVQAVKAETTGSNDIIATSSPVIVEAVNNPVSIITAINFKPVSITVT